MLLQVDGVTVTDDPQLMDNCQVNVLTAVTGG